MPTDLELQVSELRKEVTEIRALLDQLQRRQVAQQGDDPKTKPQESTRNREGR